MSNYFGAARRVSAENVSTWNQSGGLDESRDRPGGRRCLMPGPLSVQTGPAVVSLRTRDDIGSTTRSRRGSRKSSASANRGIGRTLDFPLDRVGWCKGPKSRTSLLPCKSSVNICPLVPIKSAQSKSSSQPLLLVVFDSPAQSVFQAAIYVYTSPSWETCSSRMRRKSFAELLQQQ